ncbi:MAG: hypothetical protein C4B58_00370 [Deltaproteobacteria bacterium]|nr:MAG: hypothetical protein C4B58_00370 [Deltaproteobacteria bacterium]
MKFRSLQGVIYLSLLAFIIIIAQALLIVFKGEAFCVNEGCRIVEALTLIPPFYFNLLGAAYFFSIFCIAITTKYRSRTETLLRIVLISGLAAEGILLGYQIFVANAFCSYCLLILLLMVILNSLMDLRQLTFGLVTIVAQLVMFSLLNFDTAKDPLRGLTLDNGTYAVRRCSDPLKQLYLIFSEDCPHCYKVIETLEGCTRCEFHFNPIKKIRADLLPGLNPNENFLPEINTAALRIFGIDTVPVLIAKDHDGLTFIQGDRNIINYIQNTCFREMPLLDGNLGDPFETEGGACSINENY